MGILAEILSSRVRSEIFRLLYGVKPQELYMRELERRSGFSIGTIQSEVKKLLRLDLLKKRHDGNRTYYSANKEHPLYFDIRNLVLKTIGLVDILRDALKESHAIKMAFVFGSIARQEEKAASDIDLMVLGDITLRQLSNMLVGISDQLSREVNPHALQLEEFIKRKAAGDPFVTRLCEESKIFIVGAENDFEALA